MHPPAESISLTVSDIRSLRGIRSYVGLSPLWFGCDGNLNVSALFELHIIYDGVSGVAGVFGRMRSLVAALARIVWKGDDGRRSDWASLTSQI
jgi:hypothetical protein